MSTINKSSTPVPRLGMAILDHWVARFVSDEQIGDLVEEFQDRALQDKASAERWFYRQCVMASMNATGKAVASDAFLKYCFAALAAVLFITLTLFVSWLSNMDEVAPDLWAVVTEGKVHALLINGDALVQMGLSAPFLTFGMLVNVPSVIYFVASASAMLLLCKTLSLTTRKTVILSSIVPVLPYLYSLIVIGRGNLAVNEIGPIMAFGVLSALYLLPFSAWLIFRSAKPLKK